MIDGMTTLEKGKRITDPAQRSKLMDDLKAKYERGATIRALAEATGRSYGWVHRLLEESGVTLRAPGGGVRGGKA